MILLNEYLEISLEANFTGQNLEVLHMPSEILLPLSFPHHEAIQTTTIHFNSSNRVVS